MSNPAEAEQLAVAFEAERGYLRRIAYGTLGSFAEADDVVQEAWLRLQRVDGAQIDDLRAWLTTVVGRLALDALGSARSRRERYVGPWLPEPAVGAGGASGERPVWGAQASAADARDPADRVTLDEEVTTALLVVLERLSPAERTAFVLHDVFGLDFGEVAEVVGRSPAAVRQLASRARRHVDEGTPRYPASREEHAQIVTAFAGAWQAGDVDALVSVLDPDVVMTSDGGGIVNAIRRPVLGRDHVLETLAGLARANRVTGRVVRGALVDVNGLPGLVLHDGAQLSVVSCTIDRGRIVAIDVVRNPQKLQHVPLPPEAGGPPSGSGAADPSAIAGEPSAGDDAIEPSAGDDAIEPSAGDDAIEPSAGDDAIEPSAGDDAIEPSAGDDAIEPSAGDDAIEPPAGDDAIEPSAGDDAIEEER
ncbi:RNA polymerase sigma factor SigJ [Conexibacter sp. CPCC 206217]|uniref:RNA polymerase sigma factor SigJ n=1 Tax=Conexibacter sp. CPCC 206217 TaxID=3064574 RepID=UPI00271EA854|nr:RNA polymerase sigma factor SigJ [Conexibacter sp. CPCC 206217]MDO8214089.1 RNA polymerase sigma factor SigJ [Conexibacter sp. CPCC 206217]